MRIAFTSSRAVRDGDRNLIERTLAELCTPIDHFVTGACIGGDQHIASTVHSWWPQAGQTIVVPADTSRVDTDWLSEVESWDQVDIRTMPRGTSYRDRNTDLLVGADRLIAFPDTPESKAPRSGTWMTVRLARAAQIPIVTVKLWETS